MANIEITNIDLGRVLLDKEDAAFEDALLTFGAAGTVKEGTILARSSVTGNLVPFAVGGSNGAATPVAMANDDIVAGASGDVPCRVITRGKVNRNRIVIHADGDGDNLTNAQCDLLRSFGITPIAVAQLGAYDNPQS